MQSQPSLSSQAYTIKHAKKERMKTLIRPFIA